MKKIPLFLVFLFIFVLTRAEFEKAGKKKGVEFWKIDEVS